MYFKTECRETQLSPKKFTNGSQTSQHKFLHEDHQVAIFTQIKNLIYWYSSHVKYYFIESVLNQIKLTLCKGVSLVPF